MGVIKVWVAPRVAFVIAPPVAKLQPQAYKYSRLAVNCLCLLSSRIETGRTVKKNLCAPPPPIVRTIYIIYMQNTEKPDLVT